VGSTNRLEEGLAILRAIVRSDAVRDVRERVRQGAMVIAESGRVPRLVAVGAGVVAALLDEPAGVYRREQEAVSDVESWSVDETEAREDLRDAWRFEHEDDGARGHDDEGDRASQETATLRDLQGEQDLEQHLLGATDAEREEEEDDGERRLLRFETDEVARERPDDGRDAPPERRASDSLGKVAPAAAPAERAARPSRSKQATAAKPKGVKAPAPKARQPKRSPKPTTTAPKSAPSAPVRRPPRKK